MSRIFIDDNWGFTNKYEDEILKDGTEQYLVKIGLNKFILNVTKDSMCWVMDLC